jgi:glutathione S-transferase
MLTIYGVPLSVHTRKAIVTAILKNIDYKSEVVIPVMPGNPPPNWGALSPTGLIPVMRDGDFTLADSTAICLYLEKKQPAPAVLPADIRDYARVLWFDAYAGGTIFRHVVHPLFAQMVVGPKIRNIPTDGGAVNEVLTNVQPKILSYLDSQIAGRYLVGDVMTLADIAITSNFIVYQYLGLEIDATRYPNFSRYVRGIMATTAFQRALADERPFVEQMGLKRDFLPAV